MRHLLEEMNLGSDAIDCILHQAKSNDMVNYIIHKAHSGDEEFKKHLQDLLKSEQGKKNDHSKPKVSFIPQEALFEEAKVLEYGASKYGKNNYKLCMDWSRLIDASFRHLLAFSNKEDLDPETGISHLAHVKANMSILLFYIANNKGNDDR